MPGRAIFCISEKTLDIAPKYACQLPYDPATVLLGIYPRELKTLRQKTKTNKKPCTQMFVAALFIINNPDILPKVNSYTAVHLYHRLLLSNIKE